MSRVCSNHHITVQEVIAIAPAVAIRADTMVIATVTGSTLIQRWGALDSQTLASPYVQVVREIEVHPEIYQSLQAEPF